MANRPHFTTITPKELKQNNRSTMNYILEQVVLLTLTCLVYSIVQAVPLILKESSPSGEAIVAISTSDPAFNNYFNFAIPSNLPPEKSSEQNTPGSVIGRSFSVVSPGGAAAGTGRGFVSASSFNPFLLPLFFNPINFEGIGLNNFATLNNLFKGIEGVYDRGFGSNGEVKTVSAVNDNGHIYGNVKTITFDNRHPTSSSSSSN